MDTIREVLPLLLRWLQQQQSEAYAAALIPITAATAVTTIAMMPLFKCVHTLIAAALDRADASSPDLRLIKILKATRVGELELRITPKCTVQLVYKSWTLSLTKPAGWSAGTSLFSVHLRRLPEYRLANSQLPRQVLPRDACPIAMWQTSTLQVKQQSSSASIPTV